MGGVGILSCDRDVRNVLLEEKVILTSNFLQEVDIFSLRPQVCMVVLMYAYFLW